MQLRALRLALSHRITGAGDTQREEHYSSTAVLYIELQEVHTELPAVNTELLVVHDELPQFTPNYW
jgi:hypothetical protein